MGVLWGCCGGVGGACYPLPVPRTAAAPAPAKDLACHPRAAAAADAADARQMAVPVLLLLLLLIPLLLLMVLMILLLVVLLIMILLLLLTMMMMRRRRMMLLLTRRRAEVFAEGGVGHERGVLRAQPREHRLRPVAVHLRTENTF